MHSIEKQFEKNKWFQVEKKMDGKFNRSVYIPLENLEGYKKYYESYFKTTKNKIQNILDLLKEVKTDKTEIVATLYACLLELKNNQFMSEDKLLELFYNWSKEKKRFEKEVVLSTFEWMKKNEIIPV
ncbi:MAG: hypothetical protein IPK08_15770 [Bacteroidetes bacterium]|nr:hypothetical protein [Bacteroidota bacterium]